MWCVHSSLILDSKTSSKLSGTGGLVSSAQVGKNILWAIWIALLGLSVSVMMSAAQPAFLENKVQFPFVCWTNKHCAGIGPKRIFFFKYPSHFFFFFPLGMPVTGLWNSKPTEISMVGTDNYCNYIRDGSAIKIKHRNVWKLAACLVPQFIMDLVFSTVWVKNHPNSPFSFN